MERDETLANEILDQIIPQFWHSEPFKSHGFILDGFPSNETHAQYLIERGFYPDAVVILRVNEETVLKRLLKPRLDIWKNKIKIRKDKRAAKAALKKSKLVKYEFLSQVLFQRPYSKIRFDFR